MTQMICSRICSLFFSMVFLVGLSGCVATRQWVSDQLSPLTGRVSQGETRMGEMGGRVNEMGGRVSGLEGRVGQVDAKAEHALASLGNLRLERRFVLDLKEGANFAFNASGLTEEARREIDGFLSDLKGDLKEGDGAVYLIAGHTDGVGSEDYNYELGKKRAESVARYLIIHKKMDPLHVIAASYGKSAPLANNTTKEGRKKNRRVEILVYKEGITDSPRGAGPRAEAQPTGESDRRASVR